MQVDKRTPVTVLTGYLGSGKTTLLNRILSEKHGRRIAVIENEFGETGIDNQLVIGVEEEIFEMNNGCICCTVRGDLIRILGKLIRRRERFDQILIETTGLADPAPVAQTFFVDEELQQALVLDGIITLVDAKHLEEQLDRGHEAVEQIAFADRILLNKCDLITPEKAEALERRIRSINAFAPCLRTENANAPMAAVLDIGGFDLKRALAIRQDFLEPEYPFELAGRYAIAQGSYELTIGDGPDPQMQIAMFPADPEYASLETRDLAERAVRLFAETPLRASPRETLPGAPMTAVLDLSTPGSKRFALPKSAGEMWIFYQHLPEEFNARLSGADGPVEAEEEIAFRAQHEHEDLVNSVSLHFDRPLDEKKFEVWLENVIRLRGTDIFRMKGVLDFGVAVRFVLQGVHMLVDAAPDREWGADEPRQSQLVFIGRELDGRALRRGFEACAQ